MNGANASFWRQVVWVVRKDLIVELRGGEALFVTLPFGALALLLVPMAVGTDAPLLMRIGPGMLWVVVLLFGMLVTVRSSAIDPPSTRTLLRLSGLDPAAAFLGRAIASAGLLLIVIGVLTPVMVVLYASPPVSDSSYANLSSLGLLAIAGAAGIALIGSLAASLVSGVRAGSALASLLVVPLAIPVVLATTQGTDLALSGRSNMAWLLLLVAMDLAVAIAGVLVSGPLDDTVG